MEKNSVYIPIRYVDIVTLNTIHDEVDFHDFDVIKYVKIENTSINNGKYGCFSITFYSDVDIISNELITRYTFGTILHFAIQKGWNYQNYMYKNKRQPMGENGNMRKNLKKMRKKNEELIDIIVNLTCFFMML